MKEAVLDTGLVAYCGLYCGACRAFLNEKCPGCHENTKAGWCKLRACCIDKGYKTCAECAEFSDVNDCKKFNNIISKIFAFIFKSNRKACIDQIRDKGIDGHAGIMFGIKKQTLSRN